MFTKTRTLHQQVTPAEVTGALPCAALLAGCPHGKDGGISSTGDGAQADALGHRAWTFGWLGCLDAPELLPVGGVRAVFIDPAVGGMGWEGNAAITRAR